MNTPEITLAELRTADPKGWLGFNGQYAYLVSQAEIPKGAIDDYAPLSDTETCLDWLRHEYNCWAAQLLPE